MTDGNEGLILLRNRCLSGREGGSGGQRAGEQTNDHSDEAVLLLDVAAVANDFTQTNASGGGKTAGQDDDQTEKYVGLKIAFEISEELGTCNETNGGNKEDQTKALDQRQTAGEIVGSGRSGKYQTCVTYVEEQCTENQCDDEYTRITQGDALDGDSAQCVSNRQNGEYHEQKGGNIANGNNSVK